MERTSGIRRFNRGVIGTYAPPHRYTISAEQVAAYSAAVNAPQSRDGLCPPLFIVVPAWQAAWTAMSLFDLALQTEENIGLGLHESQSMTIARRLRVGEVVESRSVVKGMRASPLATKVLVTTESVDASGRMVAVQDSTTVFLGERGKEELGTMSTVRRQRGRSESPAQAVRSRTSWLPSNISELYARASHDGTRLHVDDGAARAVGLSGTLVHGMCLLAVVCEQLRESYDLPDDFLIEEVSVRFAGPAHPGSAVETLFSRGADPSHHVFETVGAGGAAVLRDGYFRVRSLQPAENYDGARDARLHSTLTTTLDA